MLLLNQNSQNTLYVTLSENISTGVTFVNYFICELKSLQSKQTVTFGCVDEYNVGERYNKLSITLTGESSSDYVNGFIEAINGQYSYEFFQVYSANTLSVSNKYKSLEKGLLLVSGEPQFVHNTPVTNTINIKSA